MQKRTAGTRGTPTTTSVRLDVTRPLVTRDSQVPGHGVSHSEKLRGERAVDLRDNVVVERTGNGFLRVRARDGTKRHR